MKKLIAIELLLTLFIFMGASATGEEVSNVTEPYEELIMPTSEPTPESTPEPTEEPVITPEPTPEPTEEPIIEIEEVTPEPTQTPAREVKIAISPNNSRIWFGDTVTINATLINFTDEDKCTFMWQWSVDNEDWNDIPNSNSKSYSFIVTEDNYKYYYRVVVYH